MSIEEAYERGAPWTFTKHMTATLIVQYRERWVTTKNPKLSRLLNKCDDPHALLRMVGESLNAQKKLSNQ